MSQLVEREKGKCCDQGLSDKKQNERTIFLKGQLAIAALTQLRAHGCPYFIQEFPCFILDIFSQSFRTRASNVFDLATPQISKEIGLEARVGHGTACIQQAEADCNMSISFR